MTFEFIRAESASHSLSDLCRVLGVSRSGYYAWRGRPPSPRSLRDQELKREIVRVFHDSRCTYGSPRIHPELREAGFCVSRKRVARLMRETGITAQPRKKRRRRASAPPAMVPVAGNVLDRQFDVPQPNQVWVTDISYVWTWEGWLYLAVVLDLYSRRVVGWAMADHMRTELVEAAFEMAVGQRIKSRFVCNWRRGSRSSGSWLRGVS